MSGWRFYARRAVSGLWLSTDVSLAADVTDALTAKGRVVAKVPLGLDLNPIMEDGHELWLERGTKLYAELDQQLKWVGVLDYAGPRDGTRELEFTGLRGALDWMPYEGTFPATWRPSAAAVIVAMLDRVQTRPNGNLGITVAVTGTPPTQIGDTQPPPRPAKPPRRAGESADDYDDRLLPWEQAVDAWEAAYGKLKPYSLESYTYPIVGEELDQLASEALFEYRMVHRWTDRAALQAEHVLELSQALGVRRADMRFIEGVNIMSKVEPTTSATAYANDVIVLGSGEGPSMAVGRSTVTDDGRLWSAKILTQKDVATQARLQAIAEQTRAASAASADVDSVEVWDRGGTAAVATLQLGDEVLVEAPARRYSAWRRVLGITRSTRTPNRATLTFSKGG